MRYIILLETSSLVFPFLSTLKEIDIRKNRIKNLNEQNIHEFLCLHTIKSMELVEKTKLLKRLYFSALLKIYLDRHESFREILLMPS